MAVSAAGLAANGLAELLLALLTGSVGLLGDAIRNLSATLVADAWHSWLDALFSAVR